MAGYFPSSFLRVYRLMESRSINSQKKERGQYQSILTERAWPIKDLLLAIGEIFLVGHGG